jgi:CheY-like chemotaxis protein
MSMPRPRLSVLVVDSYEDSATSLALVLELYGHAVRTAFDADAAVRAADEARPDVVVLDPSLPGADGYALARRLTALPGGRPMLIALTGYVPRDAWGAGQLAPFDHLFLKPADPGQLVQALERRGPRAG